MPLGHLLRCRKLEGLREGRHKCVFAFASIIDERKRIKNDTMPDFLMAKIMYQGSHFLKKIREGKNNP